MQKSSLIARIVLKVKERGLGISEVASGGGRGDFLKRKISLETLSEAECFSFFLSVSK